MNALEKSKMLIFGLIAVLLVGIPLSLYLIGRGQETRSQAEKATVLSFLPKSTTAAPIKKQINDSIPLDINVDPGTNIVSFVKLEIQYDETKLATAEADTFVVNENIFPVTLEGPVYFPGKIAVTLSVGSDPTKALQTIAKAATVKFKAIANTNGTPTNVTYGATTEILSIGSNDQASENVLLSVEPAIITIGEVDTTATPTGSQTTPTTAPTTAASATPVPTKPAPTSIPPTIANGPTTPANQIPVCQSLNIDREETGGAPYSVTFTAVGIDNDGTINKVAFNYGDGPVETVTESGGIGTNSVSVQKAHTYNNPGTYQSSIMLTDNANGISDLTTCRKTIIVLAPTVSGGTGGGGDATGLTPYPTATLSPTGPGEVFLGAGIVAALLTVVGGFIFVAL